MTPYSSLGFPSQPKSSFDINKAASLSHPGNIYARTFQQPAGAWGKTTVPPSSQPSPMKHLFGALGLLAVGLLLHRVPGKPSSFKILSSDWRDWARMALGVAIVNKGNKAMDWTPAPWQLALETVTALTFLSHGLSRKGWRHFPLLAVFVPMLVQGSHYLNELVSRQLESRNVKTPPWVPKMLIALGSTIFGMVSLRGVIQSGWYGRLTGQAANNNASGQVLGTEVMVCTRCSGQHLICMSEIGDMVGSIGGWFKNQKTDMGANA